MGRIVFGRIVFSSLRYNYVFNEILIEISLWIDFSHRKKVTPTELSYRLVRALEEVPQRRENTVNFYLFCLRSRGPRRMVEQTELVWTSKLLNFFSLGIRWLDTSNSLVFITVLKMWCWVFCIRKWDILSFFYRRWLWKRYNSDKWRTGNIIYG